MKAKTETEGSGSYKGPPLTRKGRIMITLLGLALLSGGLVLGGWGGLTLFNAIRSLYWPTAKGTIISSKVGAKDNDDGGEIYSAHVLYSYNVGGKTIRGDRVKFGAWRTGFRIFARKIVDRYDEGDPVVVYYALNDPSNSVLEPGIHLSTCGLIAFTLLFAVPLTFAGGYLSIAGTGPNKVWQNVKPTGFKRGAVTVHKEKGEIVKSGDGLEEDMAYPISKYESVSISKEERSDGESKYEAYPVRIEGEGQPIDCEEFKSLKQSYIKCLELAETLDFTVIDRTTGEGLVWNRRDLRNSLLEEVHQTASHLGLPDPPLDCLSKMERATEGIRLEIPRTYPKVEGLIPYIVAPWFVISFLVMVFIPSEMIMWFPIFSFIILGILIFCLTAIAWVRFGLTTRIDVSGNKLAVSKDWILWKTVKETNIYSIRDITVVRTTSDTEKVESKKAKIIVRSQTGTLEFGQGLSMKELQWMRDVLAIKFKANAKITEEV